MAIAPPSSTWRIKDLEQEPKQVLKLPAAVADDLGIRAPEIRLGDVKRRIGPVHFTERPNRPRALQGRGAQAGRQPRMGCDGTGADSLGSAEVCPKSAPVLGGGAGRHIAPRPTSLSSPPAGQFRGRGSCFPCEIGDIAEMLAGQAPHPHPPPPKQLPIIHINNLLREQLSASQIGESVACPRFPR
jgi:hypothetical protein